MFERPTLAGSRSKSGRHTLLPASRPRSIIDNVIYSDLRWSFRRGSVVRTVWPLVLMHTLFATLVVVLTMTMNIRLAIPNVMLTVLGVVLGFVISYRANSGYDRYYAGRTSWSDIVKNSRIMARLIWYHIPPCYTPRTEGELAAGKVERPKEELARVMAEKRSALDLIEGFAVAVKHHLRGEAGIYYEDLYDLVRPLHPESLATQDSSHFTSVTNSSKYDIDLVPAIETPIDLTQNTQTNATASTSQPKTITTSQPQASTSIYVASFNTVIRSDSKKWNVPLPPKPENRTHKFRPKLPGTGGGANLPLEILRCLSEYLSVLEQRESVPGTSMGSMMGCVAAFEDSLGSMEKVLATPLPFVFGVHIRHTVWLYLFFLPFQLVKMFEWYSILGTAIAAFIYLGFVAVGEELEQPFGYEPNDLDLDYFCKEVIRVDISRIKRSPCVNAWFSRRWKERIMKEEQKVEERWKGPLGIRRSLVRYTPPKTIPETVDTGNGKAVAADDTDSDTDFEDLSSDSDGSSLASLEQAGESRSQVGSSSR